MQQNIKTWCRGHDSDEDGEIGLEYELQPRPLYNKMLLLTIQAAVCFLSNGALPSIQSYSCLPYGNTVYHLAVTLNAIANPLMAFLAFFVPCTSQGVALCLAVLGWALSTFILASALASPGMIAGLTVGGSLVVITWVVTGALFSYVKVKKYITVLSPLLLPDYEYVAGFRGWDVSRLRTPVPVWCPHTGWVGWGSPSHVPSCQSGGEGDFRLFSNHTPLQASKFASHLGNYNA